MITLATSNQAILSTVRYHSKGGHDGDFVKTTTYRNRLVLSNRLSLEVYKREKEERVGIKFIEVTVVEDV